MHTALKRKGWGNCTKKHTAKMDRKSVIVFWLFVFNAHLVSSIHYPIPAKEMDKDWVQQGQDELQHALGLTHNTNVAKNVILFLGDGMGPTTVWAARIYSGQTILGQSGEEYQMAFEKFNHVGLAKTYNTDFQIPDSAGTATAFLAGVKARYGTLGVNQHVALNNCSNQADNQAQSIMEWSMKAGKSVGIVTTTRLTHATPAAGYAHSASRYWESDTDFNNPKNGDVAYNTQFGCKDIARQLIEDNPDIQVLLGGGRTKFLPNISDPEYPDTMGERSDDRNLIQEWIDKKSDAGKSHAYVWNKEQFDNVNPENTDYLLGIFEPSHMQYEIDKDTAAEPTLTELTQKAIQILKKNDKGFFLLVEGGRIDQAHHDGLTKKSLEETRAMADAVKHAQDLTSEEDTLIVVTADHSHSFTTQGYTSRGNDILGLADNLSEEPPLDGLPYMTLIYANGPGVAVGSGRPNLTRVDTTGKDFLPEAHVPLDSETHGGEDVAIYAQGPMAHLFHGVHEQNYVAHVMGYASCVGPNTKHCDSSVSKAAGFYSRLSVVNIILLSVLVNVLW